jgi:hypothetical protein
MRLSRRGDLWVLASVPARPLPAVARAEPVNPICAAIERHKKTWDVYRDLAERTSDARHFARRDSRPKMGYTYLPLQYHEENPMQDLIQNYVGDLNKLREVFHNELVATSEELSKAMALYAKRSDAALASFMEKASARGRELEASAAARLNQFCGQPANGGLTDVDKGPLTQTLTHSDAGRIAASAERAVADSLHVESDRDRKPQPARSMTLVKSGPAA